jgi:hypothetical protein
MAADDNLAEELARGLAEYMLGRELWIHVPPGSPWATPSDMAHDVARTALEWLAERGRLVPDGGPAICGATDHADCGDACCQRCHAVNIVWFTDSAIWNRVMPDDGVLCVRCFVLAAESAGVGDKSAWLFVPEFGESGRPRLIPDGAEPVTEHAQLMAGGGMHVRYDHPEIDRIFPLDQWIAAGQRGGGRVFRRTVLVVDGWTEIVRATAPEEAPDARP